MSKSHWISGLTSTTTNLSLIARRYNQSLGQLAMLRGCFKGILETPYLSQTTAMLINTQLNTLKRVEEWIKEDYQLCKKQINNLKEMEKQNGTQSKDTKD